MTSGGIVPISHLEIDYKYDIIGSHFQLNFVQLHTYSVHASMNLSIASNAPVHACMSELSTFPLFTLEVGASDTYVQTQGSVMDEVVNGGVVFVGFCYTHSTYCTALEARHLVSCAQLQCHVYFLFDLHFLFS